MITPVSVIARGLAGSKLQLDGKPVVSAAPATGVLAATISPATGLHELALVTSGGSQKSQFFVRTGSAAEPPDGWKAYRPHPPGATGCDTCHAVKNGSWAFRAQALSAVCFQCHDQKAFAEPHSHNERLLADCQSCHDPHGSTERFHLKLPRETACKQCHG
ncbi:MAG: hypothetical protein HY236_05180 [Acidobacteria bacterium]|nr:hypothetical protein [Acidobacteriota bacterium]